MSQLPELITEQREHVLLLTLNRDHKRNALSSALAQSILDSLSGADADENIRCVVIAAHGGCFCAGADLDEGRAIPRERTDLIEARTALLADLNMAISRMHTPVIAAVDGPAVGAGVGLSLGADLVLASPRARFALPEVKHGISAALLIPNLIRQVGPKAAFEMLATGDPIDAERALSLGMINRIVASDLLLEETLLFATKIASFAPAGMAASKRCFQQAYDLTMADAMRALINVNDKLRASSTS